MRIGISLLGIRRNLGGNYQYAINMLQDLAGVVDGGKLVVFYDHDSPIVDEQTLRAPGAQHVRLGNETRNPIRALSRLGFGLSSFGISRSWVRGRYSTLDHYGCDAIFHPYWGTGAFIADTPAIAAVHDCAPREAPGMMSWRARLALDLLIRSIVRHARFLLADSEHGRGLLVKYYRACPDRVVVLPFRPPDYLMSQSLDQTEAVLKKYEIEPGYLFLPGRWGSYKNTERVLAAMKLLLKSEVFLVRAPARAGAGDGPDGDNVILQLHQDLG